jgi:hypothetical protein
MEKNDHERLNWGITISRQNQKKKRGGFGQLVTSILHKEVKTKKGVHIRGQLMC